MIRRVKHGSTPSRERSSANVPRRMTGWMMPTLMDRLRDDSPHRQTELPDEYAPTQRQMRDIVQRDIAYLLNTTNIEEQIDLKEYPEAAASTINFGMPQLAGTFASAQKWEGIQKVIKRVITDFEPRLIPDSLEVALITKVTAQSHYNSLLFEVRGMIHMEPYPLEFLVQSSLDLETSEIRITG
jgi:type VI secretion system protein ImpF